MAGHSRQERAMPDPRRPRTCLLAAATAVFALHGCKVEKLVDPFPPPELTAIVVTPSDTTVQVGDTVRIC